MYKSKDIQLKLLIPVIATVLVNRTAMIGEGTQPIIEGSIGKIWEHL